MSDDVVERKLARLRPRGLPAELVERIGAELERPGKARVWGDRCLASALCAGAVAACVIVGVLAVQPESAPLTEGAVVTKAQPVKWEDSPLAFARVESEKRGN